ncbi:MAG: PKD domain-containing protein, partial [Candidatus Dormibacterales bacterium]
MRRLVVVIGISLAASAGMAGLTAQAAVAARPAQAGTPTPGPGGGGWTPQPSVTSHPRGIVPRLSQGQTPAAAGVLAGALSTNPYCPACNPPLLFNSASPIMGGVTVGGNPGHVTITPVYWTPSGYSFTAGYKTVVNGYIANVAAASKQNTNVFSVSTQYYEFIPGPKGGINAHIGYVVQAGAEVDATDAFPAQGGLAGCTANAGFTACVTDSALQAELQSRLAALSLPIDDSHLYTVMFPSTVETCFGPGPASPTNQCSTNVYCAYHSGAGPPYLLYTNEPYPDLAHCSSGQAPNGDAEADAQVSLISHEANEAITDSFGAWMDSAHYENGDECAYVYGIPLGGSSGTFYNQVIGAGHYYTQDEFSNEDYALGLGDPVSGSNATKVAGCIQGEELPTASFTAPAFAIAGAGVAFDGSASSDPDNTALLTYSWSWGDGTASGSGATASHTFASSGTFTVTLSVTDIDGWTGTVSHSVIVQSAPPIVAGYFQWFDKASPGMLNDNIHILNPGGTAANVTVSLPAVPAQAVTVAPGAEAFVTFPAGTIGGPVTVSSSQPVLASQRVQYYSTFNEVWAESASQAATTSYVNWYDKASPGILNDNIHFLNPGATMATVTVSLGAASQVVPVGAGAEAYVSFPKGSIGGPVKVVSDQPVLASQRVQY